MSEGEVMEPELVAEERLWQFAAEQCHKFMAAWKGVPCKGCPGGCALGRIAVATANAALAEVGVVAVGLMHDQLTCPFRGTQTLKHGVTTWCGLENRGCKHSPGRPCLLREGAVLVRARKEGE